MLKTKKNRPTACRGLNKTNCIFPCELVKRKMGYCRSKFKRLIDNAKTKKEKYMLLKQSKKITQKIMKAKRKIKKGTDEVKKATNEMGIIGSISNFFKTKPSVEENKEEVPEMKEEEKIPEMKEEGEEVPEMKEEEIPEETNEIEKPVTTEENNVPKTI